MLIVDRLNLAFGMRDLFKDLSFTVQSGQRIGLVGRNGAGKSTLLKVLAGMQAVDSGSVNLERGLRVAYMPQDVVLLSSKTILEETCAVFEEAYAIKREMHELEERLSADGGDEHTLERYQECCERIAELDVDSFEVLAKQTLQGLGLGADRWDQPVSALSVGWKMRVVLAKLLLQKADLYLFDEPTNHLDIVAQSWFFDFLKRSEFSFLLVSHDRYFLDHACSHTFELELGRGTMYTGNYTTYIALKEQQEEVKRKTYEAQQRDIKRKMEIINKFRASAARASTAQSMLKQLDKMDLVEIDYKPTTINFSIPPVTRSGEIPLKVHNLSKAFGDKTLFKDVSFEVARGEKVALVAANGVGKTTLLSIVMVKLEPDSGFFNFGYNVKPALFEQDQERSLKQEQTVLHEVETVCLTGTARQRARSLLGAFLFSGDDVEKKIKVLSGGEKNRVAMVKVLLAEGNFLLLDEPTNHLDLQSKEILGNALKQFDGTMMFVSHDRTFLDSLATRVLELTPTGIRSYKGNYESYVYAKKQEERALQEQAQPTKGRQGAKQQPVVEKKTEAQSKEEYDRRKKLGSLESKIAKLEQEVERLGAQFATVLWGSDAYKKIELEHQQAKKKLEECYEQWEELQ